LESAAISHEAAIVSRDIVGTQRRIIEEFDMAASWSERYETLIEFGRRLVDQT
jgi:sulfur transfer protein SufE